MQIATNHLNMKKHPTEMKTFFENIQKVLQKIGSSNKTKALHKLAQEEMLYLGYGTTNIIKNDNTRYGVFYLNGNKFSGLLADVKYITSEVDRNSVESSITKILEITKEIQRVRTTITDTSAMQLKQLEKNMKEEYKNLLDSIDYFDLVDIYYDIYLRMLFKQAQKGKGKNKIFEAAHKVFNSLIRGILKKNGYDNSDRIKNKQLDIIIDFIFASLFTDSNSQSIISTLTRMYGKEDVEFLKIQKPSKKGSIKGLAELLTGSKIINVTPNNLVNSIKLASSNEIYNSIESSINEKGELDSFISLCVSSKYKSSIFNAKIIDESAQNRLEELLLNFKRDIILKK